MLSLVPRSKEISLQDIIKELEALPDVFADASLEDTSPKKEKSYENRKLEKWADRLAEKGQELIKKKAYETALPIMEVALEQYINAKNFSESYNHIQLLHDMLLIMAKNAKNPKDAALYTRKMKSLRSCSLDIVDYMSAKNHTLDTQAHFVGVNEVGFSSDLPLGTAGLGGCVCVMIRDQTTNKVALAHVSAATDPESLEILFNGFYSDSILDAKLLGAGIFNEAPPVFGYHNVEKIYRILKKHNVRITHSTLLERDKPTQIIVYPKSFKVKEGSPGIVQRNSLLNQAASNLSGWNKPLRIAFNFGLSQTISAPLHLDRNAVRNLKQKTNQHYETLPKAERNPPYGTASIEMFSLLQEAYDAAFFKLEAALDSTVENFRKKGIQVADYTVHWLKEALSECPIHVGDNAEIANRPLEYLIREKLFVKNNKAADAMSRDLALFEFPEEQPYKIVFKETNNGPHVYQALERLHVRHSLSYSGR